MHTAPVATTARSTHVHQVILVAELRDEDVLLVGDASQRDVKSTGRDLMYVVRQKLVQCLT